MNKKIILLMIFVVILEINKTSAYYFTTDSFNNSFITNSYKINLHTDDGFYENTDIITYNGKVTLPIPIRDGYSFDGYHDIDNNKYSEKLQCINQINNKDLYADWIKNYYNVNYYLNNELVAQRRVGFGDNIDNIDVTYLLDKYHTFNGWNNYQDTMPSNDINLYANVSDSHCKLTTGHGPSSNALALKRIFNTIGYNATMRESDSDPTQYLVETDYSLTLKEFEDIKEYLETNTNYTSYYPYPYLYWLGLDCDNGYSKNLQRSVGNIHFE